MSKKTDSYVVACILTTLLTGHKRDGYRVVDIFTNQQDDIEIYISMFDGRILEGTLRVTAAQ
jgi:hypothetical protein